MYFYVLCILCILFGCFCSLTFEVINVLGFLLMFGFVFVIKLAIFRKKTILTLVTMILIVSFSFGVFMGMLHNWKTFKDVDSLYGTMVEFEGTVTHTGDNFFEIKVGKNKYTVYNFTGNMPEVNDCVFVDGILQRHSVSPYPGAFNSRLYNALKGNVGHITCNNIKITESKYNLDFGDVVRNYINKKVFSFKAEDDVKGFIIAVLTGDKNFLDEDTVNAFSMCGISHIIAISGLHVGIFLSLFLGLSGIFGKKKIARFVFAVLLVMFYTILVGGRASVIRAGIMAIMGVAFLCLRKRSDPLINLSTAGLIICMTNPFYSVDAGFILSFAATFIIVFYAEFFKRKWIAVPFIIWVFMLPLSVYYCNVFSLETVVVNLIVIPLMPFLIFFGYVGCIIPFVSKFGCAVAVIIIRIAEFFSSLEFLHIYCPSTRMYQFVVWGILLMVFYAVLSRKKMSYIYVVLLLTVCGFVNCTYINNEDDKNKIRVNFINCGNFNMQHIKTDEGKNILVDCSEDTVEYARKSGIDDFYSIIITKNTQSRKDGLEKLCQVYNVKYALLPHGMDTENLNLEKTEVLYYNYNSCNFKTDNVELNFTKRGKTRCLLIRLFDDIIAVPADKFLDNIGAYTAVSLPDEYEGIVEKISDYYIHPSEKKANYVFGNKFITSVDGMVQMNFEKGKAPFVNIH